MTLGQCWWSRFSLRQDAVKAPRISPNDVQNIVHRIRQASGGSSVTVGAIVRAMDPSVQPVLLLLPALILVSPLSGIPGLSSLGGLTIALVATQILLGRSDIWLPDFVLRRSLPAPRLAWSLERLDRFAAFIDKRSITRAEWLLGFPGPQLALTTCIACGVAMPFLELVPFSATTLAVVVSILAAGLLVRDGLLVAFGLSGFGFAIFLIVKLAST
jgi:hypothetical protein